MTLVAPQKQELALQLVHKCDMRRIQHLTHIQSLACMTLTVGQLRLERNADVDNCNVRHSSLGCRVCSDQVLGGAGRFVNLWKGMVARFWDRLDNTGA